MTTIDFLKKLNSLPFDTNATLTLLHSYISHIPTDQESNLTDSISSFFESIAEEKFTEMRTKLEKCISECNDELKNARELDGNEYLLNVRKVKRLLQHIDSIYKNVAQKKYQKSNSISTTVDQHESNLQEIKGRINDLNSEIKSANSLIDDKIFSLLINTVAILGIFVAIAFTGLGTMSIFSNIDLETSIESTGAFLKNIFFLLLVSTMVYNLLIVLIYFIFKLSRPINISLEKGVLNKTFRETISLKRFFWIDGILTLLTIAAFIASLCVK